MLLFTHLRLAQSFADYEKRVQCVQARLQAISVLSKDPSNVKLLLLICINAYIDNLSDYKI